MAGFYYSNPYWGQGMSNLAEALFPDPTQGVRAGLLGDQRRLTQAERRKMDAEALSGEIKNRETQAALDQLAALVEAAQTSPGGELMPGMGGNTPMGGILARQGIAQGQNVNNVSAAMSDLVQGNLAQGTEDQRVQSLVMGGKPLGYRDAVTAEGARAVQNREIASADRQNAYTADQCLAGDKYSADRQLEGSKYSTDQDNATSRYNNAYDAVAGVYSDAYTAGLPGGKGKGGAATGKVVPVDDNLAEGISQMVTRSLRSVAEPGFRVSSPQQAQIEVRAAELYQQNQNLPVSVQQAMTEILGVTPEVDNSGDWFGSGGDSVVTPGARPAPAAKPAAAPKKVDPNQALNEARAALATGRISREEVIRRLRANGIDPTGL